MNAKYTFQETGRTLAYVKPVKVSDLPDEVQDQAGEREELFAVHDAEGKQLALVAERDMAFVLARENDMTPMTLH